MEAGHRARRLHLGPPSALGVSLLEPPSALGLSLAGGLNSACSLLLPPEPALPPEAGLRLALSQRGSGFGTKGRGHGQGGCWL